MQVVMRCLLLCQKVGGELPPPQVSHCNGCAVRPRQAIERRLLLGQLLRPGRRRTKVQADATRDFRVTNANELIS